VAPGILFLRVWNAEQRSPIRIGRLQLAMFIAPAGPGLSNLAQLFTQKIRWLSFFVPARTGSATHAITVRHSMNVKADGSSDRRSALRNASQAR
jgi:hypothetical protein